ncbi:MAG: FtsX-like permease family protein [Pseudomonadota bacterium]
MFRNYLMTALRNHLRQIGFTLISLAGLMLGLAVATLALLHVWQETHFDHHVPSHERIFLVETERSQPGRSDQLLLTAPGPLAPTAAETIDGIEKAVRVWQAWYTLSVGERLEFNYPLAAVDTDFPAFIGLEMIEGSIDALANPSAALVSKSMAERLFGEGPYLGQILTLGGYREVEISGVYEDFPTTSHMDTQVMLSMASPAVTDRRVQFETNWNTFGLYTYLRLAPSANPSAVGDAIEALAHRNVRPADGVRIEDTLRLSLEPLTDLHLNGKDYAQRPTEVVGNRTAIVIAVTIALLVLVVACINAINIATARSADRAHEVGLRKVVGASRSQLVVQFLGESALLVLVAMVGALVIVELTVGPAGDFIGRTFSLSVLLQPGALALFALLIIAVVLLSGLYPAFVLASFKPARIFQPATPRRGFSLRSALVVFQFVTSICLMVMAGTVWQQVRYLETADLGFNRKDVILLFGTRRGPEGTIQLTRSLKQAIGGKPGIVDISGTHSSPSWDYADEANLRRAATPRDASTTVDRLAVGTDFFDVLLIEPVAGRAFDMDYGPDRAQWDYANRSQVELPLILNMAAVSTLGYAAPEDVIGEAMNFELSAGDDRASRVVGVVPDFHFKSLKSKIRPMVFFPDPSRFNAMMVRIDGDRRDEAIASLEAGWDQVLQGQALSRAYLDRELVTQYVSEQRQFTVLAALAGVAVFIAMLGLVGLLAHAVTSRRREISLRKVLGAEVRDVLRLFLWQFSRPVLVAVLIAWPIAWILAERWLSGFAYRISLAWWIFVGAGLIALGITWALTAAQVLKVSRTMPAQVLQAR